MGNAGSVPYSNGQVALTPTESPIDVVSANASVNIFQFIDLYEFS